jgi:hypothetical protein
VQAHGTGKRLGDRRASSSVESVGVRNLTARASRPHEGERGTVGGLLLARPREKRRGVQAPFYDRRGRARTAEDQASLTAPPTMGTSLSLAKSFEPGSPG